MDIHLPEMFGWHPKKEETPETEPSRFTKWSLITLLALILIVTAGLTAYYFSEYLTTVFSSSY